MTKFKDQTLLVTGASGNLGRLAVENLLARGATKVIAGTRDPSKLADLAAKGAEVRALDFGKPETVAAALTGVDRLLIVSTDAIGGRLDHHKAAIAGAKSAGVKHIVYTSAPAPRPNADGGAVIEHFWTEVELVNSGIEFTVLRNNMYAENNFMDAAQVIQSGQLFGLIGDRGVSYVARADAAATAAGALLSAEGSTIQDVTGPAPVTNVERAALYAELSGKPVTSIALPDADLQAGMVAAGLPAFLADMLIGFQKDARSGHQGVTTDAVERFAGHKPQAFADFLAANRAALGL